MMLNIHNGHNVALTWNNSMVVHNMGIDPDLMHTSINLMPLQVHFRSNLQTHHTFQYSSSAPTRSKRILS